MTLPPIGIIGGMGPHAGLHLAHAVLAATRARRDQDHLPLAVLSYANRIPDRTAWLDSRAEEDPASAILAVAADLSRLGVRWAGIACNTAHAPPILDRVLAWLPREAPGLELVHMIDETAAFCREAAPGARRIGVLATVGTYRSGMYSAALERQGLVPVLPTESTRAHRVHRAIYDPDFGLKAASDPVSPEALALLDEAVDELAGAGAEAVVLGCTELTFAFGTRRAGALPAVDANTALARALVRRAAPDRLAAFIPVHSLDLAHDG